MSHFDDEDEFQTIFTRTAGELDAYITGKNLEDAGTRSMRMLTDSYREKHALKLPVKAGTRVRFIANLGSVLTYPDVPADKVEGTVVTVRTGSGHSTFDGDRVFVLWDDGKLRAIQAEHLRAGKNTRQARNVRMVVSDLGDLTMFFASGAREDELVHKATKDLWAFHKDGEQYVIERLFDDSGKPLKV